MDITYYIDFDGVILDTIGFIFEISRKTGYRYEYIAINMDWEKILNNSKIINNSLEVLRNTKDNYKIITKFITVHELNEKIRYLRINGINVDILGVPINLNKTDVHMPLKTDILIDDQIDNYIDWINKGGDAYYFEYGNFNEIDTRVKKTKRLDQILK